MIDIFHEIFQTFALPLIDHSAFLVLLNGFSKLSIIFRKHDTDGTHHGDVNIVMQQMNIKLVFFLPAHDWFDMTGLILFIRSRFLWGVS